MFETLENKGPTTVPEVIAHVLEQAFSLEVTREDAAFVCAIQAHLDITRQPGLEEDDLERIYAIVAEAATMDPTQRSLTAIQRLRRQGLIERADAKGMASYGLYTLSTLAIKIRDEIFNREALSKRSLRVLMRQIVATLAAVSQAARRGGDKDHWDYEVVDPLRVLVADVVRGLIMRQKGLDSAQVEVRAKATLLLKEQDWKRAVPMCTELLDQTSATLQELHGLLLQEIGPAQNLLLEIAESAIKHQQPEAHEGALRLNEQVSSIAGWSKNFHETWTEFYTRTQEYIRLMLRVDPNRKMSHRLRESVKAYAEKPWFIRHPGTERYRNLREDDDLPTGKELAKVEVRERRTADDSDFDVENFVEMLIASAKSELQSNGTLTLSQFLAPFLATYTEDELHLAVASLTRWLLNNADLNPRKNTGWTRLRDSIEIQDVTAVLAMSPRPATLVETAA